MATPERRPAFSLPVEPYPKGICRNGFGPYVPVCGLPESQGAERARWITLVKESFNSQFDSLVMTQFADASDLDTMRGLLRTHGIFIWPFFKEAIRDRITRRLATIPVDLTDTALWAIRSMRPVYRGTVDYTRGCPRHLFVAKEWIIHHICNRTCLEAMETLDLRRSVDAWFDANREPRACSICGGLFRVIDFRDWQYYGANGCVDCCYACPIVRSPAKHELPPLIRSFVDTCGFIPDATADFCDRRFNLRLRADSRLEVYRRLGEMGGTQHVAAEFGSWFKALADAGVLPDRTWATGRGIKCFAKDGHECHSLDERQIDDWLFKEGVPHEREPAYPIDDHFNPWGQKRADWKSGDAYIEYFGLIGDEAYEKKVAEKLAFAAQENIRLIIIYPPDLEDLSTKLRSLIPKGHADATSPTGWRTALFE